MMTHVSFSFCLASTEVLSYSTVNKKCLQFSRFAQRQNFLAIKDFVLWIKSIPPLFCKNSMITLPAHILSSADTFLIIFLYFLTSSFEHFKFCSIKYSNRHILKFYYDLCPVCHSLGLLLNHGYSSYKFDILSFKVLCTTYYKTSNVKISRKN